MLEDIGSQVIEAINAKGRPRGHVIEGAVMCAGAVLLSALVASKSAPAPSNPKRYRQNKALVHPGFEPPPKVFGLVWPPLFLALAWSGLRVWNAPPSPQRSQALKTWGAVQALNALWMLWGPKRQRATLATAVVTIGGAAAYALDARKVDKPAAAIVTPYLGWISYAGALTEELWRRNRTRPTIH